MADRPKIRGFKQFRVVLGDPDDETTWAEHTVRPMPRDVLDVEVYLRSRKRKINEVQVEAQMLQIFYALRRTGAIAEDATYDDFTATCLDFDTEDDAVDPTQPAPESDF